MHWLLNILGRYTINDNILKVGWSPSLSSTDKGPSQVVDVSFLKVGQHWGAGRGLQRHSGHQQRGHWLGACLPGVLAHLHPVSGRTLHLQHLLVCMHDRLGASHMKHVPGVLPNCQACCAAWCHLPMGACTFPRHRIANQSWERLHRACEINFNGQPQLLLSAHQTEPSGMWTLCSQDCRLQFMRRWVRLHIQECARLGARLHRPVASVFRAFTPGCSACSPLQSCPCTRPRHV